MADIQSNININIDTSAALANLKNLQREISATQRELSRGTASNAANARELQRGLLGNINATGQFAASLTRVKSSAESFTNALEKNKLSMGEYFRYAGASSKTFGRLFTNEFNTIEKVARERVKTISTQYIKLGRTANGAVESISVRPLIMDMDNLATKTAMAAQKQQIFNQLMKQGSTNLLNFGKNTQWAGRQLMVGFTIPLTLLGTQAAKTFMELEEQAIRFRRVYGESFTPTSETDAMITQVRKLATEFTKYGVAVEKTMELAATAAASGKMGADLLAQVAQATRLAVLGGVDQAQALETTISVTNAFGVATEDLAGKINFLNAVENQTVTSIEDLTIAIPKAGPVVKQLGGDVEDLSFFLTAMKEGGINASEGANALKSGLASLINPTASASKFLQGFGVNIKGIVEANKGDVKGLVVDFAQALDTLDPLNRARAIEQLFGKFQFARISTLFKNVIDEGSQAARVLKLTNSTTAELAILSERELKKIEDSPMYKFKKAFEELKVSLAPVGEAFLKAVTPFLKFGTDLLSKFNDLSEGSKTFLVGLTVALGAIGPIAIMTFGLLANGVAQIIKGFLAVRGVFSKSGASAQTLGAQTGYMTNAQLEAAAAAASLDQVHGKLTQTFGVEKSALMQLTNAYNKAIAAQSRFGVAPIPTTIGKGKKPAKYAKGVSMVPGPKGAGDVVPAMLAPGEAIIPADKARRYSGFIQGMIAGNIPGFEDGLAGAAGYRYDPSEKTVETHLQERSSIVPGSAGYSQDLADKLKAATNVSKMDAENQKRVFAYGDLFAKLPRSLNENLKRESGVALDEFEKAWTGTSDKLTKSLRRGFKDLGMSFDPKNPIISAEIAEMEKDILRNSKKLAAKSGGIVNDAIVSQATQQAIASGEQRGSSVAKAMKSRAVALREYRTDYTAEELRSGVKSKKFDLQGVAGGGGKIVDPKSGMTIGRVDTRTGRSRQQQMLEYNRLSGAEQASYVDTMGLRSDSKKTSYSAGKTQAQARLDGEKSVLGKEAHDPIMLQRSKKRNSPHPQAAIDGRDDARARVAAARKETARLSKSDQYAASLQSNYGGAQVVTPQMRGERKQVEKLMEQDRYAARQQASAERAAKAAAVRRQKGIQSAYGVETFTPQMRQERKRQEQATKQANAEAARQRKSDARVQIREQKVVAEQQTIAREKELAKQAKQQKRANLMSKLKPSRAGMAGGGMAVSSLAMGASMIGGPVGEAANQLMGPIMAISGIASVMSMLPGPIGAVVAGLGILAYGVYSFSENLKKATQSGIDLANSMSMTKDKLEGIAEITGTVSATAIRERTNQTLLSGLSKKQLTEGEQLLSSSFGAGLLTNAQTQKQGGRTGTQIGQNLGTQLATAASQGVITAVQAESLAAALSEKMKDYSIQVGVVGQLNELIGWNGQDLKNNPLEVRLAIQTESMNQQVEYYNKAISKIQGPKDQQRIATSATLGFAKSSLFGAGNLMSSGIGAAIKGLFEYNTIQVENNKLRAASTQLAVQHVASNQGAIDSLQREYDLKIQNAKTDEEIIALQKEKADALKVLNAQNATQLSQLRDQALAMGGSEFSSAIGASVDQLYKDADSATKVFVGETKKSLQGLADSDFKTNLQIGLASGTMDYTTVDAILKAAASNKTMEATINASINAIGMDKTGLLTNMIKNMGGADNVLNATLRFTNANPEDLDNVVNGISYLNELRSVGLNVNINTTDPAKLNTIGTAMAALEEMPDVMTKTQLQELKAKDPKTFAAVYGAWAAISGSDNVVSKKLILEIVATGDRGMVGAYIQAMSGGRGGPVTDAMIKQFLPEASAWREKTLASANKPGGTTTPTTPTTPTGGTKATDPINDILAKLKDVRDAGINAAGGIKELAKSMGSATKNVSIFGGVSQAFTSINASKGFMDFYNSLDDKAKKTYATVTKVGNKFVAKLTTDGARVNNAFKEISIGDFQAGLAAASQENKNRAAAFNKLTAAGLDSARALEIVQDADLALAIATRATSAEVKILINGLNELAGTKTIEEKFGSLYGKIKDKLAADRDKLTLDFELSIKADKTRVTEAEKAIANLQYNIDDVNAGLQEISWQEEDINNAYDKRFEALDKIEKLNSNIADQQKGQLSLADALSRGDISAAANLAQEMRAKQAENVLTTQRQALEKSKETEINNLKSSAGLTRVDLERQLLSLEKQVFYIEESKLEPANNAIRLATELRDIKLAALDDEEFKWRTLQNTIDLTKTKATKYAESLVEANKLDLSGPGITSPGADAIAGPTTTAVDNSAAQAQISELNTMIARLIQRRTTSRVAGAAAKTAADRNAAVATTISLTNQIAAAQKKLDAAKASIKSPVAMSVGGMVPKYFAVGGFAKGTDTIPAMLTPGEFVVKKYAVDSFGADNLKAINNGTFSGGSVYNNYDVNINVKSDANANDIARTVITEIKRIDSQRIRGNKLNG